MTNREFDTVTEQFKEAASDEKKKYIIQIPIPMGWLVGFIKWLLEAVKKISRTK